jgi:hypothetical protein
VSIWSESESFSLLLLSIEYSPLLLSVANVNYHQLYVFTVNDITYLPINTFIKCICLFPYFLSLGSRFSSEQRACAIRYSFNSLGAFRILNLQTAHACILVRIAPFQSSLPVALPINTLIVMRPLNLHKSQDSSTSKSCLILFRDGRCEFTVKLNVFIINSSPCLVKRIGN